MTFEKQAEILINNIPNLELYYEGDGVLYTNVFIEDEFFSGFEFVKNKLNQIRKIAKDIFEITPNEHEGDFTISLITDEKFNDIDKLFNICRQINNLLTL